MQQHVKVLGILYIAFSIIFLLIGIAVLIIVTGAGIASGDRQATLITGTVGVAICGFFVVMAIPGIITGIGLMKFRPWARIVGIILGALHIMNFPFGTALAVYAFWVLLNQETTALFERGLASSS
jgi:hypothetical protein